MDSITSTAYSRDLGDELRRLRESCTGIKAVQFAELLGWHQSKVSTIERGKARASEIDLAQFLTACGKNLEFFEEFRRRYQHAFDLYFVQVTDSLRTLAMTEALATKIVSYDFTTIPGLLQTKAYTRELFKDADQETPEEIEKYAEVRGERQAIMRRASRPDCLFYVHEVALQLRLGDAALMEEQYMRLLYNTHTLRLIPAHISPAALRTDCVLYRFEKAAPVVFSETNMAQLFAQDTAAVARAERLFERLDRLALDEVQSRSKLMEYINALRGDSNGPGTSLA